MVLAGDAGEDRERPDAALGALRRADPLERAGERLAGEVLLGDRPAALLPALARRAPSRSRSSPSKTSARRRSRSAFGQRPGGELVVAVGEQAGEQLRRHRGRRHRGSGPRGVDGRQGRKGVAHRIGLYHPFGRALEAGCGRYHRAMYFDALSFLEDERDAWRPFEALLDVPGERVRRRRSQAAHGWSARELLSHLAAYQAHCLDVARELALGERSPSLRGDGGGLGRARRRRERRARGGMAGPVGRRRSGRADGSCPASCAAT